MNLLLFLVLWFMVHLLAHSAAFAAASLFHFCREEQNKLTLNNSNSKLSEVK